MVIKDHALAQFGISRDSCTVLSCPIEAGGRHFKQTLRFVANLSLPSIMEAPLLLAVILGCLLTIVSNPAEAYNYQPCNNAWKHYKGNCYHFRYNLNDGDRSFDGHQKRCRSIGGNLASIHDYDENNYIWHSIRKFGAVCRIGFEDKDGSKAFQWLDGSRAEYTNWGPGHVTVTGRRVCANMQDSDLYWRVGSKCDDPVVCSVCKKPSTKLPCAASRCLNGGNCVEPGWNGGKEPSDFTCACQKGYSGKNCELDVDECKTASCASGKCVDGRGSYECV
ncbi:macrophage mannose receptor 1-like [Patiria miniata]|uniref:Uncharacterized protein n=1 Tax=Patiria miniata TaxID=46514 RepID=A0A913ZGC8_PATMI|nr:macrophage mannose receptor 1-like [Patiria miniata]